MYVVRSGRQWDNPRIQFITSDEEIAKRIIAEDQHRQYKNYIETCASTASTTHDRMLFHKYKIKEKMPIDQYDKDRYKNDKEQYERYSKAALLTFEEWLQTPNSKYADWFYEECDFVDSVEDGLLKFIAATL